MSFFNRNGFFNTLLVMQCSKALFYVFFFLIHMSIGFALPEDTFKTKKDCAFCHKAKKGGGPLNDAGLYYQKHGNLLGYQPQDEIKKAQSKKAREKIKQAQKKKKKPPVIVAKKKKKKPPVVVAKRPEEKPKIQEPTKEPPVVVAQKKEET